MVTPVCQAARAGTLTQKQLLDWTLTGGFINEKNSNGVTPLCSAAIGGHPNVVRFLLQNGAQVNEPSHHDCTALWFATRLEDEEKAYRITNTLLRAGADVNCVSSATILNTTPLMNAIRNGLGMKVLSLLLTNKASQDHPVKKKHSGTEDAKFIDNKQYIDALKDPSEVLSPAASKSFMVKSVNSLFEYIVAVVNRFTNNALTDKLGIRGSTSDSPRVGVSFRESEMIAAQKFDPVEFNKSINEYITTTGLDKFFPMDSPFLQTVVKKASDLANKGTTALARPEHLLGLTQLSLYQPILFCDNSGSMKTVSGDRIDAMIDVSRRITEIATHLVPDDEGVEIRFLNSNNKEQDLYKKYGKVKTTDAAAKMVAEANYSGGTKLGTILRDVILKPYVYEYLEKGHTLERPLLISIITDGCPSYEADDELDKAIIECKEKLQAKGYDKRAVNFQISQIGNDSTAEKFLSRLQDDDRIKDYIFCSSEKLDEKFKELRDNDDELEIWLFNTLMGPLLQAS